MLCTLGYDTITILFNMHSKTGESWLSSVHNTITQTFRKRLKTLKIAFRIRSECPFIERLVLVKTFS